jgi:hypothetical protein
MSAPQPQQTEPKRHYITPPKFTEETARRFDRHSATNAAIVRADLTCECEPYIDVLTFGRWRGLGMRPAKGSKAHRVMTWAVSAYTTDEDPERVRHSRSLRKAILFCRCQVVARRSL